MARRVWRRERGPARPAVCVPCRACAWVSRRETGSFMVVEVAGLSEGVAEEAEQ